MRPKLLIINDRIDEFEGLKATIFTPGQGICLQRLNPTNRSTFQFDYSLAYGSWYDIQIIAYPKDDSSVQRYLITGIYLTYGKQMMMTELTDEKYCDHGIEWKCSYCEKTNIGSVAICEHCHANKWQRIMDQLSRMPVVGIPFSITSSILKWGRAAQSNKSFDQTDAVISTISAAIDVVTVPFIVGALGKILTKAAAQTGTELTVKTIFCEAGKPILEETCKVLGPMGIIGTVISAKMSVETIIRENAEEK